MQKKTPATMKNIVAWFFKQMAEFFEQNFNWILILISAIFDV